MLEERFLNRLRTKAKNDPSAKPEAIEVLFRHALQPVSLCALCGARRR